MFQDSISYNHKKPRQKGRVSTRLIDPEALKPLLELVDEGTFKENIGELESKIGLRQISNKSETFKDLRHYLKVLLGYPNYSLAQLHRQSHRLGSIALKLSLLWFEETGVGTQNMEMVGISTYMFFRTMKNLIYFLILALILFGIYSFVSNIRCSQIWKDNGHSDLFTNIIEISLGAKIYLAVHQGYSDFLIWQVWFGLAFVVLLMAAYLWMQHVQVEEIEQIQYKTRTVADYSIVLKGVPTNVTKQQIQRNLNQLCGIFQKTDSHVDQDPSRLKVAKINTASPINVEEDLKQTQKQQLKQIQASITQLRQQIISWVMQLTVHDKFQTAPEKRRSIEEEYLKRLKEKNNKIKEIVERVKQNYQKEDESRQNLTHCFVTFESTKQKQKLLAKTEESALERFLKYLSLTLYHKKTEMKLGANNESYQVQIQQADEPQDVMWGNIGLSGSGLILRKCITFLATFLVLGASFAVIYGLSTVQVSNQNNQYISFLISLSIVVFNTIINFVLRTFTALQKNTSYTGYQSSYAVKAILAQLINTIVLPILVNRFLKQQNYIYTKSGLADDVFLLGLTSAFVTPLLKIFDSYYFFSKYIIVWYYSRPEQKFRFTQIEFNQVYENMLFQSGYEYIYVISLYLWTCFFMSLQPVIIAFSIAGFLINYWAQKYCLFHRCKRPVPGTRTLYNVMVQFVYAGGLFYALGSLTFINFIPEDVLGTELKFALIANIITVSFAGVSMFIPYSYIYARWLDTKQEIADSKYEKQRILFPSQYDRANPATSDKALEEYFEYVNKKKQEIQKRLHENKNDAEMTELFKKLSSQGRNFYMRTEQLMNPYSFSFTNPFDNIFTPKVQMVAPAQIQNFILGQLFYNNAQTHHSVEPRLSENPAENRNRDNIIRSTFKKATQLFSNKQQNQENNQHSPPPNSDERLNGDFILDETGNGKNGGQNKQVQPGLWEIMAEKIREKVPQNGNPVISPMNYGWSPYNSKALSKFKMENNMLYNMSRIQSQTGQSYKNISNAIQSTKRSIKLIPGGA